MKNCFRLSLLLISGTAFAAESHTSIPAQFQGAWASSLRKCSSPELDDLRMQVTPGSVAFWESSGRVLGVAMDGELELAVIVEMSGEGERWLEAIQFRLSADRKTLTDVTGRRAMSRAAEAWR